VARPKHLLLLMSCALWLAACGGTPTPEQQVREVIAKGKRAAEERDFGALMRLVSRQYSDDEGRDVETLEKYVRGYLLIHPSIHLLTRIDSIDFPYSDMARVHVTVGSLATGAGESLDLAADVQGLDIELVREDGSWRVRRASRSQ
jgi:hypothetical protein